MSPRCRLLLGLGCWTLSLIVAPDTWRSIDSRGLSLEPREVSVLPSIGRPDGGAGGAADVRVANTPGSFSGAFHGSGSPAPTAGTPGNSSDG